MRKGKNISKEQVIAYSDCNHRIIIPLHIPKEDGYYKQSYEIFEMTLESLIKTSLFHAKISVISDACCSSVNSKLYELYEHNQIDELILEHDNIGKVNAILKVLRSTTEPFVTITDADVLFLNNWDAHVFEVFKKFPKAAVVSPTPIFRNHMNYTANIWIDHFFSKRIQFKPVKNPVALERFAQSLGWTSLEQRFKDVIVTLQSFDDSLTAVVGATHFVATYKRAYLKNIPGDASNFKLGGSSEGLYLDQPPYIEDGYRLSTYDNYAYHMGNHLEDWLQEEFRSLHTTDSKKNIALNQPQIIGKSFVKKVVEKLFLRAISNRNNYNYLLRKKGLPKEKIKTFWY